MIPHLQQTLLKIDTLTDEQQEHLALMMEDFITAQKVLNSPFLAMALEAVEQDRQGLTLALDNVLNELEDHA